MSSPREAARTENPFDCPLTLALPKGRMQEGVFRLLADAGISVRVSARGYRPSVSLGTARLDAKILKPQNAIEMLDAGTRDVGFAGADWVSELGAEVVEILDTGLDQVRVVAAAPAALLVEGRLPTRPIVVASEYERLTRRWVAERGYEARLVRSYGATEVFPPDDADCIVDLAASGDTLRAHGLVDFDTIMTSSTRLYASRAAAADPVKRRAIEALAVLLRSVLESRRRVMLEVNVSAGALEGLVAVLPCMREPTIASLHGGQGFAVKAAVPRAELASLIPVLQSRGGTDIVVYELSQIIP